MQNYIIFYVFMKIEAALMKVIYDQILYHMLTFNPTETPNNIIMHTGSDYHVTRGLRMRPLAPDVHKGEIIKRVSVRVNALNQVEP